MSFLSIDPTTKAFLLHTSAHAFVRREVTPRLDVPLAFTNRTGSAVVQPMISVGHAFAKGDVQSAAKLQLSDGDGNPIALQQDRESYWNDGSLKFAVMSFRAPETYDVDQKINYRLTGTIGQPDRTITSNTLSHLTTTHDFKLRFSDGDCGNDTFTVAVNTIAANGRIAPSYGSNPLDGYELIRSGPICSEWRFWSYLKRDSDGAAHAWIKATLWIRSWGASGPYEVSGLVTSPNCWGPHPSGTVAVGQTGFSPRFASNIALYDGDTALAYWGGPNDSDAFTLPVSSVFQAANHVSFPSGSVADGRGVVFSGNDLPAGIQPGYVYWPQIESNYLITERNMVTYDFVHTQPYVPGLIYSIYALVNHNNAVFLVKTPPNWGYAAAAGMGTGPTDNGTTIDDPPAWAANTPLPFPASCKKDGNYYSTPILPFPNTPTAVVLNQVVLGNGLYYQCTEAGTTSGQNLLGWPSTGSITDGSAIWQAFGTQMPTQAGTTGTIGPSGNPNDLSNDGTVLWQRVDSAVTWYAATAIFSGGSGNVTVSPMPAVFLHTGVPLVTKAGEPVWIGSGSRPRMLPTHDLAYLFYQTKATPPYVHDLQTFPMWTGWQVGPIHPNDPGAGWDISSTGDNPGDDRIGYCSHTELNTLLGGDDVGWEHRCRFNAITFIDRWNHYQDERSGWGLVTNNGPDGNGGLYPHLGPPAPYAFAYSVDYAHGLIGASIEQRECSGYIGRYGVGAGETSHLPAPWFVPYLRSGDDLFFHIGMQESIAVQLGSGYRYDTVNGVKYFGLTTRDGQTRGLAWGTRVLGSTEFVCPANHPLLPMIADCLDDSADWLNAWTTSITGTDFWACGAFGIGDSGGQLQVWQHAFCFHVFGTLALQGERTGWRDYIANYGRKMLIDLYDSDKGGSDYRIGHNPMNVGSLAGNGINTVPKMWLASIGMDPTQTDNATGIAGNVPGPDESLSSMPFPTVGYYLITYDAIVIAIWLNIPDALKVALRVKKRFDDGGLHLSGFCGGGGQYAGCFSAFPTFAFALPTASHIVLEDSSNILNEDSSILSLET